MNRRELLDSITKVNSTKDNHNTQVVAVGNLFYVDDYADDDTITLCRLYETDSEFRERLKKELKGEKKRNIK